MQNSTAECIGSSGSACGAMCGQKKRESKTINIKNKLFSIHLIFNLSSFFSHSYFPPENFVFASEKQVASSTALARRFERGQVLTTMVGSAFYVTPEVLQGAYDELAEDEFCA